MDSKRLSLIFTYVMCTIKTKEQEKKVYFSHIWEKISIIFILFKCKGINSFWVKCKVVHIFQCNKLFFKLTTLYIAPLTKNRGVQNLSRKIQGNTWTFFTEVKIWDKFPSFKFGHHSDLESIFCLRLKRVKYYYTGISTHIFADFWKPIKKKIEGLKHADLLQI